MNQTLLHTLSPQVLAEARLPHHFNNPFHYSPHPLCSAAIAEVMQHVAAHTALHEWFRQGKMLGVLVVRSANGVGFLAAYSGRFEPGTESYFVPPVFDLTERHDFYDNEDRIIMALNQQISHLESDAELSELCKVLARKKQQAEAEISAYKQQMQQAKTERDKLRSRGDVAPEVLRRLIAESQFQKAELRRKKNAFQHDIQAIENEITARQTAVEKLKQERKERSVALQREIFSHFRFHNARGAEKTLVEIFAEHGREAVPPSGTGECAGPKLLEYAYRHGLQPVAMAEFWYGKPTVESQRKHGCCYPACQDKCAPILSFMLQGLPVEPLSDPTPEASVEPIDVLYEDDDLLIVDKPGGVLSVPGKGTRANVLHYLAATHPDAAHYLPVHRLDMDTSGLLLLAKNTWAHRHLQQLFMQRAVEKEYRARLSGRVTAHCGLINLPLSPDPYHRPKQRVDKAAGKCTVTYFEVLERTDCDTLVRFMPLTGRTHQLRVHAATAEGLNAPIVGDRLYGAPGAHLRGALCLHACSLKFRHPRTGQLIHVTHFKNDAPSVTIP